MTIDTKRRDTGFQTPTQETQRHVISLLDDLPAETLAVVERFVEFLHEQTKQGWSVAIISEQKERPPYLYPTIPLPASVLDGLIGIMPPVNGDALADTEALYDDV